jgi:hypothetical protein
MTRADYSVALTRALHQANLSHATYAILIVLQNGRAASVSEASEQLGLIYHGVVWHLRKYPDLFTIDKSTMPHRVQASPDGEQLLLQIENLVGRYIQAAATPRPPRAFRPARVAAAEPSLSR